MRTSDWLRDIRESTARWLTKRPIRNSHRRSASHRRRQFVEVLEARLQLTLSIGANGWEPIEVLPEPEIGQTSYLRTDDFAAYRLNVTELSAVLAAAPLEFSNANPVEVLLPNPDGSFARFAMVDSPIMAPELAAQFPDIKTFAGQGIDDPAATIRIDLTPAGFHAQVLSPSGAYYIDPYFHLATEYYASYFGTDLSASDLHFDEPWEEIVSANTKSSSATVAGKDPTAGTGGGSSGPVPTAQRSGTELRTYRTAVAATGEYVAFHGGTVGLGQAAIVTAINRVSGIYESELSVRLQLVASNSSLVYTNSATDPYSNSNPSALLTENQANVDAVIGNANYDIGHVFTTGGGGLAGLGVVGIDGQKARGETGLSNPIGDAFYVDFVAHEMGHQFGGNHTFNGVNGSTAGNQNASTAYEPGSGSTIQAYAGISGADNLQSASDPFFHSISFDEIINHVDNVIPGVGTRTLTGNNVPTVEAGPNYTIPAQTPFTLTAVGSDGDVSDVLTYSWEERDLGAFQAVSAGDNGSSPLFRVFNPTTSPSRTFQRLSDLLNNTTVVGERLPTTTRKMDFRVTVRDNRTGGGGVNTDDMRVNVVNTGAAFAVTSPNTAVTLTAHATQTVTWNVAGTTGNGINTANVNILLSTDGGATFPVILAANVPNDGSQSVVLPNTPTTSARIKVEGAGNIFFDLSNVNFTIGSAVNSFDFGDAPDAAYATTNSNNGARHTIGGPSLGQGIPDDEPDGQPNASASGDGTDEDGVTLFEPLVAGTTAQIRVRSSAGGGKLNYFFDFDNAGGFGNNANEVFSRTLNGGSELIPVTIPAGTVGPIYARFRISAAGGLSPTGAAGNGEVEDYLFDVFSTSPNLDFGDAPDPNYATTAASDGARHILAGPQLGATRDGELAGQANATATGDGDDEDGVTFPQIFQPGASVPVKVTSSVGGGQLNAFFDWNRNGIWGDVTDELVFATLGGGTETITVTVPSNVATGVTYARFRISTAGGLGPTGFVTDGEVEDYQLFVVDPFQSTVFQNFDGVTAPALPSGWTNSASGATPQNWATVSGANSDSAANHAFVADPADTSDSRLTSPSVVPTLPRLKFRNNFNTEDTYDGGVLEISVNSGAFTDIVTAGGSFVSGGYTDTLLSGSALEGRQAWTGSSGGYIDTIVTLPPSALNQNVQFRWRFASDTSVGAIGWRVDTIQFSRDGSLSFDYGDAPDPSYPTLLASSGASHAQGFSGVFLGSSVDAEGNGLQNGTATGDDAAGDDENGVTLPASVNQGATVNITVNASVAGLLSAWIDFNDDGDWTDSGEQIARDRVLVSGDNTVSVVIPLTATVTAQTFARFRISTNSGQAPDGRAPDGEVEDYAITILNSVPGSFTVTEVGGGTTSVNESGTTDTVSVVLGAQPVSDVVISVLSSDTGEATASPVTLTFTSANWNVAQIVTVTGADDALLDGSQTSSLTFSIVDASSDDNFDALEDQVVSVTTTDNDTATASLSVTTQGNEAGPSNIVYTVTLTKTNNTGSAITFDLDDLGTGTATTGSDYTAISGSAMISVAAGASTGTLTVLVTDDALLETTETVIAQISNSSNAAVTVGTASATANITDNDTATASLSVTTPGNEAGPANIVYTVTLTKTNNTSSAITFDLDDLATGTATIGSDYTAISGSAMISVAAGASTGTLTVLVTDDALLEATETVIAQISNSSNAAVTVGTASATANINDNDTATASLSVTTQGNEAGPANIVYTVTLTKTNNTGSAITFDLDDLATGTATTGSDYTAISGSAMISVAAGASTGTLTVLVTDDALLEATETVIAQISNSSNAAVTVGTASATANITDNDTAMASLSVTTPGNEEGPANIVYTVTLTKTNNTGSAITFDLDDLATGTATTGSDYTAISGSAVISVAAGASTGTLTVLVTDDALLEATETVIAQISNSSNAAVTVATPSATANITDNDAATASLSTTTHGNEAGPANIVYTVTLSKTNNTGSAITVELDDLGTGTATSGSDYTAIAANAQISVAAGASTGTLTVLVIDDVLLESTETVIAQISNSSNAAVTVGTASATASITDNDVAGFSVTQSGGITSVNESGTTDSFDVLLTAQPLTDVVFTITNGDATEETINKTSLTFTNANWNVAQTVTVTGVDDGLVDGSQTTTVTLSVDYANSDNAFDPVVNQTVSVTTIDNEIAGFTIVQSGGSTGVTEAGGTDTFTVVLNAQPVGDVVLTVSGNDSTEATVSPTTLTFNSANWNSAQTVTVTGADDFLVDGNVSSLVTVAVDDAASQDLFDSVADQTVAITTSDNDTAGFTITQTGGTTSVSETPSSDTFTVVLTAQPVSVVVITVISGDTTEATVGPATLTFTPSDWNVPQTVTVTGVDDSVFDGNQTSTLTLSIDDANSDNPFDAVPNQTVSAVTSDNDPTPSLSINDVSITEGNAAQSTATFTVTLSAVSGLAATVNFNTANQNAITPADYAATSGSLTFAPGETTKTIAVLVNGDTTDEIDEQFSVELSNAINAILADSQGLGAILDDDAAPTLTIGDVTVTEGNSGQTSATFAVALSAVSGRTISVDFATADSNAHTPGDYSATSGSLTFAPGETSKNITVPILGDVLDETNELFLVNVSNAVNATFADSQASGTIADDDATPRVTINDVTVAEEDSGSADATFTVTMSAVSGQTVSVNYATANTTAVAGNDFNTNSGTLIFAPGETTKTVTVQVLADTLDEANEIFQVNLTNATAAIMSDSRGIGTIADNDSTPILSINDVTVAEDQPSATFTVTLSAPSGQTVTASYFTASGSAFPDFTAQTGTLTFAEGETTKLITVSLNNDVLDEADETFHLVLSTMTNATVLDNNGMATIIDDDSAPSLSIDNVTVTEGNTGATSATFTVTLSTVSGQTVLLDYATVDGTALAASDYTATSGTLSIVAGLTSKTFTIPILGDLTDELDETLLVNLSNAINASISVSQGVATIADNDAAPSLSINDVTISEGNSATADATFTVTLSTVSSQTVSVDFATANNTAVDGSDFAASTGTLTFAPGEKTKTVAIPVNGDTLDEALESYFVNLSNATNATISDSQGLGSIFNDDAVSLLSIGDVTVTEGNSGQTTATFAVNLSVASGQAVTVKYATAAGTALATTDYTTTSGTLTFAAGTTTQTISVLVKADVIDELDETFFVNLSNATNATVDDSQGLGTITDDDAPPTLSIADLSVTEGNTGTTTATFTVALSAASSQAVKVDYVTADNTALAGTDYVTASGTLTIAAGTTSKTFTVSIKGDLLDEANETFFVNLSNAINASIADNQALGTIADNDVSPSLKINDVTVTEGNSGATTATFTVTLSAASGQAVTVNFATANNTAVSSSDYTAQTGTLSFAPGEKTKTVAIAVTGDTLDEANESYFVKLSGATNASISDNSGTGTITDNDPSPTLSINDVTILEGHSGTTTVTFTVTLSAVSGQTVTVRYATANNSASSTSDYTAAAGTLSFAAGVTSQTITIQIKGDVLRESNETFFVNLSNAVNATISDNQGIASITNDD